MFYIIGALAGATNGFFGAGGGMILVPLFLNWAKIEQKKAFATSVFIMVILSIMSFMVYLYLGEIDFIFAAPFLIGGFIGGIISGFLFKKVPILWLKRIFGVFVVYGGIRSLFLI